MKNINKTLYITLFAVLFAVVAFSSFWHAVDFFKLANDGWMAAILAGAFEVGQAAVLFALLTSEKDRKKVMPWVLMTMFTLVQVLGNVYASYKHIILNNVENLRFFKEPVFVWTSLPDDQATVIITYLVGGILPISSLLLTSMLTSYLSAQSTQKSNLSNESSKKDLSNESNILGEQSANINSKSSDAEDAGRLSDENNSNTDEVNTTDDITDNIIEEVPTVNKTKKEIKMPVQMIVEPAETALTQVDNNSIDNSIDNIIKPNDKQTHVVSL
jgi:hypothetical protein